MGDDILGAKICDACIDGLQADGETPCPCQADDLPRQVRNLKRDLADLLAVIHRDGGHYQSGRGTEAAIEDAHSRISLERSLAGDLLASLDPGTLNPEQFNAWCSLSEAVGYREQD